MPTDSIAAEARAYWDSGDALTAGRLLFERVPNELRPTWAVNILRLVVQRTGTKSDAIEHAINIANGPKEWSKAHDAFSRLRNVTLGLDRLKIRTSEEELLLRQVLLAELVAKVTYNATNPDDEFDEDSGWWIASLLKGIIDQVKDESFASTMWTALCLNSGGPQV